MVKDARRACRFAEWTGGDTGAEACTQPSNAVAAGWLHAVGLSVARVALFVEELFVGWLTEGCATAAVTA